MVDDRPDESSFAAELERRLALWRELKRLGGPTGVPARIVNDLRIYYGGRGIWRDKAGLGHLSADGLTVGILHTGRHYADDLADNAIIYHYPRTGVPGTDRGEVAATKATKEARLPIFVVADEPADKGIKNVALGWVEEWDDEAEEFLVSFGEEPPAGWTNDVPATAEFDPIVDRLEPGRTGVPTRAEASGFRARVFWRYGRSCAACGLDVEVLIEAAHIVPWRDNGSNDPRNGLPLCRNHHRAFDLGLIRIHPRSTDLTGSPDGPSLKAIGATKGSLTWLPERPHPATLQWRWDHEARGGTGERIEKSPKRVDCGNPGSHTPGRVHAAPAAGRTLVSTSLRMERREPMGATVERRRADRGPRPHSAESEASPTLSGCSGIAAEPVNDNGTLYGIN